MSRTVEIVMAAGAVPALAGGLGALALGVGGAAYAAYSLVKQLHEDYQDGLKEFHQRADMDAQTRQGLADGEREKADEARALIAHTQTTSPTDADALFLQHRVRQLQQRLSRESATEFAQQCDTLLAEMAQAPAQFARHLDAYRRLAETAAEKRPAAAGLLPEVIAALREEILAPLLDAPEVAETRQQLLEQLDVLQTVAVRQPTVARQGLTVLRQRVYREMQAQAKRRQVQVEQAAERRYLLSEIYAKTRAIMALPDIVDLVEQAKALHACAGQVLAQGDDDELAALRQLAQESGELFAACEELLGGQVVSAYMQDEVSEVLTSLGYQVQQVAGEEHQHRLVTPVDDAHGIEFRMEGIGRMKTEMVALTPEATAATPEDQEKICRIIDQVIEQMKGRHENVRERYRTSLKHEEELRVVEIDADDVEKLRVTIAPREKRIDES